MASILEPVGKALVFDSIRPGLRAYVKKAGYQEVPYKLFGIIFYAVATLFVILYVGFIVPEVTTNNPLLAFVLYFFSAIVVLALFAAIAILFLHFIFSMKIYNRTKELERILPDYLTLVSTNLKGGMSFEKALWDAIKPEFGVLANEIGLVSKKVMTGNEIVGALKEFVVKYDSPILRRNFQLIISEFQSGGKIVTVIDRVIDNLKKTQMLKKELVASTVTYMIFIGALVTVVAPVLFALSYQLFFLIQGFMGQVTATTVPGQAGALSLSAPEINPLDFRLFSVGALLIIAAGSGFITSVIEKGDLSGVTKYAPMYVIVSLAVYFVSSYVLSGVFSGLQIG